MLIGLCTPQERNSVLHLNNNFSFSFFRIKKCNNDFVLGLALGDLPIPLGTSGKVHLWLQWWGPLLTLFNHTWNANRTFVPPLELISVKTDLLLSWAEEVRQKDGIFRVPRLRVEPQPSVKPLKLRFVVTNEDRSRMAARMAARVWLLVWLLVWLSACISLQSSQAKR